jgi:hypothetical protein
VLNLETGEEWRLLDVNAFAPRYLATGHILFASGPERKLWAVRFDLAKLEVNGDPKPVLDVRLWGQGTGGSTDYAVSTNGVLAYTPGPEDDFDGILAEFVDVDLTEIHVRRNWFEELRTLLEH